jgi:hypothetical protein
MDCNGVTTDGCECAGTMCCAGACQPVHSNGLAVFASYPMGTTTYELNCQALGTPGTASTYTQAMALAACGSWTGAISLCEVLTFGSGMNAQMMVCDFLGSAPDCTCWTFTGPGAGTVIENTTVSGGRYTCYGSTTLGADTWN